MSAPTLRDYLGASGRPVRLHHEGMRSPLLEAFRGAAPWLDVHVEPSPDAPTLELRGSTFHGRMRVLGAIEGRLGEPVAEAARALATDELDLDGPAGVALLRELDHAVEVVVVVTPTCPFCPRVASLALRFAAATPKVSATIVRADDERAPRGLGSVPSVLVGGRVVASGNVGEYELASAIAEVAVG